MKNILCVAVVCIAAATLASAIPALDEPMVGFCFEGPPRRPDVDPMPEMRAMGANWVSLTPFAFMPDAHQPELNFNPERGWWGESDAGVIESTHWAHAAGLNVMLKPHIWLRSQSGDWRGTITMQTQEDWNVWFANYERWILHCADLAEREHIEALVVGHELPMASLNSDCEDDWRRIIASVREHYSGLLLWSAHWEREFADLPFWDALDLIGVSLYSPMSQSASPEDSEIAHSWAMAAERMAELSAEHEMPIVLTEVGYRSSADAAMAPWVWRSDAPTDFDLQARLYDSMFDACMGEPWFGGLFIWKWQVGDRHNRWERDFTPQGKPAMDVIQRHLGGM